MGSDRATTRVVLRASALAPRTSSIPGDLLDVLRAASASVLHNSSRKTYVEGTKMSLPQERNREALVVPRDPVEDLEEEVSRLRRWSRQAPNHAQNAPPL